MCWSSWSNDNNDRSEDQGKWAEYWIRQIQDFHDLKIQEWFDPHGPFDLKEVKLWLLLSGLTTALCKCNSINSEKAEVGLGIQRQFANWLLKCDRGIDQEMWLHKTSGWSQT